MDNNLVLLNMTSISRPHTPFAFYWNRTRFSPARSLPSWIRPRWFDALSAREKSFPLHKRRSSCPGGCGAPLLCLARVMACALPVRTTFLMSEDHIFIIYLLKRSYLSQMHTWQMTEKFALRFASHGCFSSSAHSLHADR